MPQSSSAAPFAGAPFPGTGTAPMAPLLSDDLLVSGVLLRRVFAWWIDLCVLGVLFCVGWLVLMFAGALTLGLTLPLLSTLPFLPLLYNWGFLASGMQATPGQALFGLIVVRDEDLGPPTMFQALVSALGFYFTLTIFCLLLLVALFTTRHRTLHDMVSGLVVVRRRTLEGWAS